MNSIIPNEEKLKENISILQLELNQTKTDKQILLRELKIMKEANNEKDIEIQSLKLKLPNLNSDNNSESQSKLYRNIHQVSITSNNCDINLNSIEHNHYDDEMRKLKQELKEKDALIAQILQQKESSKSLSLLKERNELVSERTDDELNTNFSQETDSQIIDSTLKEYQTKRLSNYAITELNSNLEGTTKTPDQIILSTSKYEEIQRELSSLKKQLEENKSYITQLTPLRELIDNQDIRLKEYESREKSLLSELNTKVEEMAKIQSENKTINIKFEEYKTVSIKVIKQQENTIEEKDMEIRELKISLEDCIFVNEGLREMEMILKQELVRRENELSNKKGNK